MHTDTDTQARPQCHPDNASHRKAELCRLYEKGLLSPSMLEQAIRSNGLVSA